MNGNLCKHLHRIHSLAAEDAQPVDSADVEMVATDEDTEDTGEDHYPVNPYSLPSSSTRSTCEKFVYTVYLVIIVKYVGLYTHAY